MKDDLKPLKGKPVVDPRTKPDLSYKEALEVIMASASNKHGVKETIDIIKAAEEVVTTVVENAKDGIGFDDLLKIVSDSDVRSAVSEAIKDIKSVPAEIADLNAQEAGLIAQAGVAFAFSIFATIKQGHKG